MTRSSGSVKGFVQATDDIVECRARLGRFESRREADRAFEWLDRAYAQRDGGLTYLTASPLLTSLRGDPRYTALLKKMRLPV